MKLNLHNKDSLSRIIVYLFSGSTLTYLIIFITSVIIFRSVDKGDYGLYVILMSVFSILELFMGGYSQSIARYLKEAIPICKKQQIILYSFYYKYFLIAIFLIILFFAKENHFFKYLINDYDLIKDNIDKFLFVAIVGSVISVMSGISNAILTSLYQYRFITTSSIIRDFTYLLSVIGLTFYTKNYLVYLYVGLLLNIILLVVLLFRISGRFSEYSLFNIMQYKLDVSIYKEYLHSYATPLTAVSLLTYVRNHLSILILGKEFELEDVSIFAIIKKLFKALHSFTGTFLGSITSRLVSIKQNKEKFKLVINSIYYGSFGARLFIYVILYFMIEYIFIVYKIEYTEVNEIIFYILGLEFVTAGISADGYGTLLKLKSTTRYILYISLGRVTVELILIYFILFAYGALGAALILLLSRYSESIFSYFFIKNDGVIKIPFLAISLISPFVIYYIFKVLV